MRRLISAICAGLILGTGLVLAFAQPDKDEDHVSSLIVNNK